MKLYSKNNWVSNTNFPTSVGIVPDIELKDKPRVPSLVSLPIEEGVVPRKFDKDRDK